MKPLLKLITAPILWLLNRFGFTLCRLPPKPCKTSKMGTILVAGKAIKIPRGSPLFYYYRKHPDLNRSLGDAAALIEKHYPKAWAVDVGANVGDTMAIIRGQASMPLICIEGDEICHQILQENARLFDHIHLHKTFLSDRSGGSAVVFEKEGWNLTLANPGTGQNSQHIQFQTLDQLVQEVGPQVKVKLLKVDTEGYDLRIIRGASAVLQRDHPVINFELNRENVQPLGDSVPAFLDFLHACGYRQFIVCDHFNRLICAPEHDAKSALLDLYHYSDTGQPLTYYDVWTFHESDKGLFAQFLAQERARLA